MPDAGVGKGPGSGFRPDPVPQRHHARRSDRAIPRSTFGSRRSARRPCRLHGALDRVLADDVVADVDVPGFDRSNVDGFAVQASDTFGAMEETPRTVQLNDEVLAPGVVPAQHRRRRHRDADRDGRHAAARRRRGADGRALGASLPATAGRSRSGAPLTAGENVSYAGTDIARGETVLRAGQLLTSREIGVLAALGLRRGRRLSPAARGDLLHRQRDRGAGQALARRRRLRLQRRDHRRGRRGAGRDSGAARRRSRRRGGARRARSRAAWNPTSSSSRAARPRARAISRTAS